MDVLLIANVELPTLEKFAHWRIQLAVVRRVKFFVQLRIQTDRGSVGVREVVSTAVAVRLVVITRDLTPVRCKALRLAARTFIKRRSQNPDDRRYAITCTRSTISRGVNRKEEQRRIMLGMMSSHLSSQLVCYALFKTSIMSKSTTQSFSILEEVL
uniref:Uncharacterized protein n=1 Tax=Glossina pallidipes TaxID=7398 RepID=A0A1A9ZS12_GLOPL